MVPSTPGCAPPPPAARSSSRPTASCRATSSCTRTCCVIDLLRLVRVNNLLLAAAGVLAGGWIALGTLQMPNVLGLAAVSAVGFGTAGYVLNDIWDRAADRVNRLGGDRPLAAGRVMRGTADLCVAGGALLGLGAAALVNGTAVLVGLVALAVLVAYSPVLKRRGVRAVVAGVAGRGALPRGVLRHRPVRPARRAGRGEPVVHRAHPGEQPPPQRCDARGDRGACGGAGGMTPALEAAWAADLAAR